MHSLAVCEEPEFKVIAVAGKWENARKERQKYTFPKSLENTFHEQGRLQATQLRLKALCPSLEFEFSQVKAC